MKEFSFIVSGKCHDYKICDALSALGISKEIIKKVKFGGVYLDGVRVENVNQRAKANQEIMIVLPEDVSNTYVQPKTGKLDVLFEDQFLIAVKKESGVITHASKSNTSTSLDQLVCGYFLPNPFVFRAINRLDRDTAGIILVAKDMLSASILGEQMKRGEIKKTYSAVVVGKPTKEHFIIEKPIKRQSQDSMKRICAEDGKYAKTECFFDCELENGLSKLNVILHTGRTHQIRVHLASVGLPLYADGLYGKAVEGQKYQLTSNSIEFIHPFSGEKIKISI